MGRNSGLIASKVRDSNGVDMLQTLSLVELGDYEQIVKHLERRFARPVGTRFPRTVDGSLSRAEREAAGVWSRYSSPCPIDISNGAR